VGTCLSQETREKTSVKKGENHPVQVDETTVEGGKKVLAGKVQLRGQACKFHLRTGPGREKGELLLGSKLLRHNVPDGDHGKKRSHRPGKTDLKKLEYASDTALSGELGGERR